MSSQKILYGSYHFYSCVHPKSMSLPRWGAFFDDVMSQSELITNPLRSLKLFLTSLVFSDTPMDDDELFSIRLLSMVTRFCSGSGRIMLTLPFTTVLPAVEHHWDYSAAIHAHPCRIRITPVSK